MSGRERWQWVLLYWGAFMVLAWVLDDVMWFAMAFTVIVVETFTRPAA